MILVLPKIRVKEKTERMSQSECFQILSLDGGGLKGLFTASFLAAIEDHTNTHIINHFDLIAGTSTGGIIALALGLGYSPKEILSFYKEKGEEIFPIHNWLIRNVRWVFRQKYSSAPLQSVLREYFGDKHLCDSSKPLIIPAFDSGRTDVHIYKTPHHKNLCVDYKLLAADVALATAAAPTYFPVTINDFGVRLIDGGIWANNPSMVALAEALGYFARSQSNIAMLSIGTTRGPDTTGKNLLNAGFWTWRKKIIDFILRGQSIQADNEAYHILGSNRFLRVNPILEKNYPLDHLKNELIGIGYTEARNQVNAIKDKFLQHKAGPYQPFYKI